MNRYPPQYSRSTEAYRVQYLSIDSRDRNTTKYTNDNSFRLLLDEAQVDYKDIVAIELVGGVIPKTNTTVHANNNKVDVRETVGLISTDVVITLTDGTYDATTFAIMIQGLLNASTLSNTYTVVIDSSTSIMTISRATGTADFSLRFSTGPNAPYVSNTTGQIMNNNSAREIMGFGVADYSATSGVLTAPYTVQLNGVDNIYIYLNVDDNTIEFFDSTRDTNKKLFFICPMNVSQDSVRYINAQEARGIRKIFDPPLKKLKYVDLRFQDYWGNLYDFRGNNVSMTLKFTMLDRRSN